MAQSTQLNARDCDVPTPAPSTEKVGSTLTTPCTDASADTHTKAPAKTQSEQANPSPSDEMSDKVVPDADVGATAASVSPSGDAAPGANGDATMVDAASEVPALNSEIEVLWELEDADGKKEDVWWKATVQSSEALPDGRAHVLLYEPYGEFSEEVVKVRFAADRELVDLSRSDEEGGGVLPWRYVGEGTGEDGDEEGESQIAMPPGAFTALTVEKTMPMLDNCVNEEHRVKFAKGVRNFTATVEQWMAEIKAQRGQDYTITSEDINEMFKRKLGRSAGAGAGAAN